MELLLFLLAGLAAALFIINNITRTALRQRKIRLIEITLAFFVALLPISALLLNNLRTATFDTFEEITFLLIIPIMIIHIGLTIVESFRPQRLHQSRGILGLGIGVLLIAATFAYNFIALNAQLNVVERNVRPTPVNSQEDRDPCTVAFEQVFVNLLAVVGDATGRDVESILEQAADDGSISLALLVEQNGGDPDALIVELVEYLDPALRDLLARDCLDQAAAGLLLSQLRFVVRRFVVDDFVTLQTFFGGGQSADSTTPDDLRATRVALLESVQQASPIPTLTNTPTPTRTPSPTLTRTPFPTLSPTSTRERFVTPTPSPTPTLPDPCIATARYNVNLRSYPDLADSEVLLTIPFETVFSVYAPNEDQTWWLAQVDGESGWVSAEFIALTSACYRLPARRP